MISHILDSFTDNSRQHSPTMKQCTHVSTSLSLLLLCALCMLRDTEAVCVWSLHDWSWMCDNSGQLETSNYVPQCTTYQAITYTQSIYNSCCAANIYISGGYCCKYTSYQRMYFQTEATFYCMCSAGTLCSTTPPKPTGVDKPVISPAKPKATIQPPLVLATTTTPRSVTTATTTTTTTKPLTTTATTTAKQNPAVPGKKFCTTYRLLNSESANECDYPGITAVQWIDESGTSAPVNYCNAVFVAAQINDTMKPAFFTSNACRLELVNLAIKDGSTFNFKIGDRQYPVDIGDMFDVINDPSKGSSFFLVKDRFASLFNFDGNCQHPACPFTRDMAGEINFNDCEVVGYGASSADRTSSGLRKVKVRLTISDLCSDKKVHFQEVNTMCFETISGENLFCSYDMGSAVFCKATSGENILIGGAAFQSTCDTSPTFRLIPYPVTKINGVKIV